MWQRPAEAQAAAGFDVDVNSAYVWRGITYANRPVIQPTLWLRVRGLTIGSWWSIEPAIYDGPNDISEGGGVGRGVREFNPLVEYARTTGPISWTLGWSAFMFALEEPPPDGRAGIHSAYNTHEFYGEATIEGFAVTPSLLAAYDAGKVKGLYLEPGLALTLHTARAFDVELAGVAGFSLGQSVSERDFSSNFAEDGFSAVDFSASTELTAGDFAIAPQLHMQWSRDPQTRINGALPENQDRGRKVWIGVTLSWSRDLTPSRSPE